eukprot:scpid27825/ scgid6518/ Tetratricopeptide repeat protein 7B; Tetratricopeptide repeat protein 7-like-1
MQRQPSPGPGSSSKNKVWDKLKSDSRAKGSPLYSELSAIRLERSWKKLEGLQRNAKIGIPEIARQYELAKIEWSLHDIFVIATPSSLNRAVFPSDEVKRKHAVVIESLRRLAGPPEEDVADWFTVEARLLYAKLLFSIGDSEEFMLVLKCLNLEEEHRAEAEWPIHARRLHAECMAMSAWSCVQRTLTLLENAAQQRNSQEVLDALQKAISTSLLYLEDLECSFGGGAAPGSKLITIGAAVSDWLEEILCTAPLLYLALGLTDVAVQTFRKIMEASPSRFSAGLRLRAAGQLSLTLLRAFPQSYTEDTTELHTSCDIGLDWMSQADARRQECRREELVRAVCIAEQLVREGAVESRFPKDKAGHDIWYGSQASAVYDVAVLALANRDQIELASLLEHSLRYAFDDEHMWIQFGLSLMCCGRFEHAQVVLRQCLAQHAHSKEAALLVCKLCTVHIPNAAEAVRYASALVAKHPKMAAGHLALGLAFVLQSRQISTDEARQQAINKSLESLHTAQELDSGNPVITLYLSLQLANQRRIADSMEVLLELLQKDPTHMLALWLAILLQTSLKNYTDAETLCSRALYEYPHDEQFLLLRVKIDADARGPAAALVTAKSYISEQQLHRLPLEAQSRLWLFLAELFLQNEQGKDAGECLEKVGDTTTAEYLYLRGRVKLLEKRFKDAGALLEAVLAQDPQHVPSMLALVYIYMHSGNLDMAEHYTSQALAVEPCNHFAWARRGAVLQRKLNHEHTAECFINAIHLESTQPAMPFNDIPIIF